MTVDLDRLDALHATVSKFPMVIIDDLSPFFNSYPSLSRELREAIAELERLKAKARETILAGQGLVGVFTGHADLKRWDAASEALEELL